MDVNLDRWFIYECCVVHGAYAWIATVGNSLGDGR